MKRKYLFLTSFIVFLVGTVFFAIESATTGSEIVSLEREGAILSQENRELSDRIIKASSLSAVQTKAAEFNFAKPEKIVYLSGEETIAKVP